MATQVQQSYTVTGAAERYRETMIFNNTLLKRNYPDWYEFNTGMQVGKMERYPSAGTEAIAAYKARRTKNYDKKFAVYCARLDAQVEPSVARYATNIRAAFGYD